MSAAEKARASAVIIIVILAIFASIAIVESNSLRWPLASEIQSLLNPKHNTNLNSSLLVSTTGFSSTGISCIIQQNNTEVTANSSGGISCVPMLTSPSIFSFPISNATITIYTTNAPQLIVASNTTDLDGRRLFLLKPAQYKVTITSIFGNATAFLKTDPGNTTELDVTMNSSSYYTNFFEISNSAPSLIAPWDDIFLNIYAASPIAQNANSSTYVVLIQRNGFQTFNRYGIQIINQYPGPKSGTLWLQAQLNSTASTANVSQVVVLSYISFFTIKEYSMSNSTALG